MSIMVLPSLTMRVCPQADDDENTNTVCCNSLDHETFVSVSTTTRFSSVGDASFCTSAANLLFHFETLVPCTKKRLYVAFDRGTCVLYAIYAAIGTHRGTRWSQIPVSVLRKR
jgi:hypothetical protein